MERSPPPHQVEESFMSNDHLPSFSMMTMLQQEEQQSSSSISNSNSSQERRTFISNNLLSLSDPHHASNTPTTNNPATHASLFNKSIFESLTSRNQIMAMLSNFSTSYNVVSISIVLPILSTKTLYYQSVTDTSESICASALIAGMILGQILGGALGDVIGRIKALYLVMTLQIMASLSSAFLVMSSSWAWSNGGAAGGAVGGGGGWTVFEQLAFWRLLLGIGCGGVYPLAASLSSEVGNNQQETQENKRGHGGEGDALHGPPEEEPSASLDAVSYFQKEAQQERNRLKMLAVTFSTQGIGFVSVPIVGLVLLVTLGEDHLDLVWRMILAMGSIPGIILMYLRWKEKRRGREQACIEMTSLHDEEHDHQNDNDTDEDEVDEAEHAVQSNAKSNLWTAIQNEEELFLKLIGTAGTWFLFDVVFYGNTLFQPVVIKTAFGYNNDDNGNNGQGADEYTNLVDNIRDSMILSSIALPGYFVSVALIGSRICYKYIQTPRFIQIQGFAIMAMLYLIIGYTWDSLIQHHWLLIFLYGSTFFFSNYGPNTTTFMLPSLTFSPDCRSTLNGISAASGKAGALIGSIMFEPVVAKYGDSTVMSLCAMISILAGVITIYCTNPPSSTGTRTRRIVSSN